MIEYLSIKLEGKPVCQIPRDVYVTAKTKQLREFGYANLTESEVSVQVSAVLADRKFGDGLTVIGMFMQKEVLKPDLDQRSKQTKTTSKV